MLLVLLLDGKSSGFKRMSLKSDVLLIECCQSRDALEMCQYRILNIM